MSPAGLEPAVSAGERPQNYTLDRAANGTGYNKTWPVKTVVLPYELAYIEC